jgi:hypothetical protein
VESIDLGLVLRTSNRFFSLLRGRLIVPRDRTFLEVRRSGGHVETLIRIQRIGVEVTRGLKASWETRGVEGKG